MFTEDSIIVKTWVNLVVTGKRTREQVPNLGNLREVVFGILDKEEKTESTTGGKKK